MYMPQEAPYLAINYLYLIFERSTAYDIWIALHKPRMTIHVVSLHQWKFNKNRLDPSRMIQRETLRIRSSPFANEDAWVHAPFFAFIPKYI
jgi:hypothetical protein